MKELNLNFIPSYSWKVRRFFILITVLILIAITFHNFFPILKLEHFYWLLTFSLLLISFSKRKKKVVNILEKKYYAGKLSSTFIISFILSLKLTSFILDKEYTINNLFLAIAYLVFYNISLIVIIYLSRNKEIKILEKSIRYSMLNNKYLHQVILILSVLTLIAILLLK